MTYKETKDTNPFLLNLDKSVEKRLNKSKIYRIPPLLQLKCIIIRDHFSIKNYFNCFNLSSTNKHIRFNYFSANHITILIKTLFQYFKNVSFKFFLNKSIKIVN